MKLTEVIKGIESARLSGSADAEIRGICIDSRRASKGEMFVALSGGNFDGRRFIAAAIDAGASAVMLEGPSDETEGRVPHVYVDNARAALASASANFFGNPSSELDVLGVTGTNGKTTTAYLVRSMLREAGHMVGMIGTISYVIGTEETPAPFTTPEAPEFQGLLRKMLDAGCGYVVSEVSSHALAQMRVDGTRFKVGVFTNLTREHLDFHKDMDNYFSAKKRLFTELLDGASVVNVDDPYGMELAQALKGNVLTFAVEHEADIMAKDISNTSDGVSFELVTDNGSIHIDSPLVGMPNVYNILSAAGTCIALGVKGEHIAAGAKNLEPIEGRFRRVEAGQEFLCIVDFAHTGDALERLIKTTRQFTKGRVITVFGCGGDRDRTKRPEMGRIATTLSDLSIITSDNPRSEEPLAIIDDVLKGVVGDAYRVVPDRAEAIELAISEAGAEDTVVIAGKGHETYQEIKGVRHDFNDVSQAARFIKALSGKGGTA